MRNRGWFPTAYGLCVLALCSCARQQEPPRPDKELLAFSNAGQQGGFYLYRRGPMGSDYITLEIGSGGERATVSSISTCAFVAVRLVGGQLEANFYNSSYFIPGSIDRLASLAAVTPDMSIRSTVKVPTAEEIAQLRQNGFTVLDCKSAANLDRTLADS
ncbi:MAG TPA: hypothetical protein PKE27_12480 [Povalibacter sp.]|uniref:hypothetical protein n=1 Tax=Povalibacter sp. TaxID=1962978 RepID=UPI002C2B42F3|nr:hypothetical protein [Povalibacter sp.]HMN45390.1 hypothetical protein [Povalibacter sp.]